MAYNILKLVTISPLEYWTFVLDSNNTTFVTTDLVVLEAKLKELSANISPSNLKIVTQIDFEIDFVFES